MIFKNYINKIGDFIIKRLAELIGIFLIVTSILLFISLISYSPEDPNFIFPENQEIKNFLGFRGSFIADIFFQSIFSLYPQGPAGDLSVVFMERSLHNKLHGEFLNDYRPTDVITFPPDPSEQIAGEICVSVEQAWDEAISRDLPFHRELSLYLIHGWLHLVGFDDIERVERKQMRFEEERSLKHIEDQDCLPDFVLAQTDNRV